ncbi:DinB family protein [Paenibacillus albiflavus]|uniref:DinB family protein n=1 Tax=Paenibacillus albiflavus TaxID=2545760 RepID=A0A4R4ENB0_9BACL|nr:DinB family protein [Paenibacillus albiflavus]TCZ79905.1 DinB family protein [Paenibacillus albiflavus]
MVNKQELIGSMSELISSVESLRQLDEQKWDSPIAEGKWAIRDIISHIALWDEYFYNQAIHRIVTGESIDIPHLDFEIFNQNAITYAATQTQDQLIDQVITHRNEILEALQQVPAEAFNTSYPTLQGTLFLITEYVEDFVGHDHHHLRQINSFLQQSE